jgi:hypothetical protein
MTGKTERVGLRVEAARSMLGTLELGGFKLNG